jgi:hypothetical protein
VVAFSVQFTSGWTSGRFLEMSDTSLSGKMTVLATMLKVMEQQNDKVSKNLYSLFAVTTKRH